MTTVTTGIDRVSASRHLLAHFDSCPTHVDGVPLFIDIRILSHKQGTPPRDFFYPLEQLRNIGGLPPHVPLEAWDREGYSVYFGLNLHKQLRDASGQLLRLRGDAVSVPFSHVLQGDFDHGYPDPTSWPAGIPQPHTLVETSPGRYQGTWKLADMSDPLTVERLNQRIAALLGSDPAAFDRARIFRLAGSRNRKPGYPDAPPVMLIFDYTLADLPGLTVEQWDNALPALPSGVAVAVDHPSSFGVIPSQPADVQDYFRVQMDRYGVHRSARDTASVRYPCPFHNEQNGTSLQVHWETCTWKCWGKCNAHGGVLDMENRLGIQRDFRLHFASSGRRHDAPIPDDSGAPTAPEDEFMASIGAPAEMLVYEGIPTFPDTRSPVEPDQSIPDDAMGIDPRGRGGADDAPTVLQWRRTLHRSMPENITDNEALGMVQGVTRVHRVKLRRDGSYRYLTRFLFSNTWIGERNHRYQQRQMLTNAMQHLTLTEEIARRQPVAYVLDVATDQWTEVYRKALSAEVKKHGGKGAGYIAPNTDDTRGFVRVYTTAPIPGSREVVGAQAIQSDLMESIAMLPHRTAEPKRGSPQVFNSHNWRTERGKKDDSVEADFEAIGRRMDAMSNEEYAALPDRLREAGFDVRVSPNLNGDELRPALGFGLTEAKRKELKAGYEDSDADTIYELRAIERIFGLSLRRKHEQVAYPGRKFEERGRKRSKVTR